MTNGVQMVSFRFLRRSWQPILVGLLVALAASSSVARTSTSVKVRPRFSTRVLLALPVAVAMLTPVIHGHFKGKAIAHRLDANRAAITQTTESQRPAFVRELYRRSVNEKSDSLVQSSTHLALLKQRLDNHLATMVFIPGLWTGDARVKEFQRLQQERPERAIESLQRDIDGIMSRVEEIDSATRIVRGNIDRLGFTMRRQIAPELDHYLGEFASSIKQAQFRVGYLRGMQEAIRN